MSPSDALAARSFALAADCALRGVPDAWDGTIEATADPRHPIRHTSS